jgi:hypothetical protein
MRLRLVLANHAEVPPNNLLYIAGGGWTEIGPEATAFAIAATIDVPWDETNRKHTLEITIVDADEKPLIVQTPEGEQPFRIVSEFEVGRPAGATAGRWFTVPVAVNMSPITFQPHRSYVVRGAINGRPLDETRFLTRAGRP